MSDGMNDLSGNDAHGAFWGVDGEDVWRAEEDHGGYYCIDFSAGNGFFEIDDSSHFDFERHNAMSLATWLWLPEHDSIDFPIFSKMESNGHRRGYEILPGKFLLSYSPYRFATQARAELAAVNPRGRWYHFAITYDGSHDYAGVNMYWHGERLPVAVHNRLILQTTRNVLSARVGRRAGSSSGTGNFKWEDMRVYGRVLKPEEIRHLASAAGALGRPNGTNPLPRPTPPARNLSQSIWLFTTARHNLVTV